MKKKCSFVLNFCLLICLCVSLNVSVVQADEPQNTGTTFKVNVVHTNDIHARIKEDSSNQVIGLPKVKTYMEQESKKSDLSLMLDGGDTFHGQSIATLVQGESVAQLLGVCEYDAMVAGNHDWNYGKDRLKELENIVKKNGSPNFSILAGNVVKEDGSRFFDREYLIKEVQKDGVTLKVGVFGVIDPAIYNATAPENVEGLSFTDMAEYANQAAEELKNQGCQIVIGMAHCIDPRGLASSVKGVNLWTAGHEHDKINEMVTSLDKSPVLIVETGYYLSGFGKVEINCTLYGNGQSPKIIMQEYPVDYGTGAALSPNPQAQSAIESIEAQQKSVLSQTVGHTPKELDGVWEHLRIGETTMGRAVTEAYLLTTGADIAFENAGGIRASIPEGEVTYQNVLDVSPYGNYIVTKELTGKEILEILETSLEIMKENQAANEKGGYDGWPANSGSMLQVGGMNIMYNMSFDKGNRIISALVRGEEIQEDKTYIVAMNNYLPSDKENYPQLAQKANVYEYKACEDALAAYLSQPEDVILEGLSQEHLMETTEKHRQENLVIHGAEGTFVYGEQGGTLSVSGGSTQKTVDFASSNEQTAMVDSEGNLSIIGAGETVITAVMAGNEQYEDVSAQTVIQVGQAETDVTLTYTGGEKPVLTATAKKAGNGTYPTGTFLFVIDKNTEIETEADANGQTSVDISNLTKGKHTASVIYQGDHNYKETSQPTVIEFEILKSVQETKDIEKPKATVKPVQKTKDIEKPKEAVKTSDETNAEFYILLALVSITGIAVGVKRKQGRRQG